MLTKGIKKYIANPIIGILPFVLYIILQAYFVPVQYALTIALIVTFVGEFLMHRYFKSRIQCTTFYITAIALICTGILWIVGNHWIEKEYSYILVGEIGIILQLMVLRICKPIIKARMFKNRSFMDKALLNDFLLTAAALRYLLTTHVFAILVYKQITQGHFYPTIDHIIYIIVPIVIIVGISIYQIYKTNYVVNKLRREEWLPIVTENGDVTGKIAKAVSINMKNKYMHPVVCVALICNKKVYLQERNSKSVIDPGKIDHPFEKYLLFKHEINQAAHNCIRRVLGRDIKQEPKFVFKYVFENGITKRLVFLYTVTIDDESIITKTDKMTGKFWSVKQIDEQFGDQIFSECFELEYEYLKHMVLLEDGDNLIAKDILDNCAKNNPSQS